MVVNVKTFSLLWDILWHMRKRRENLFYFFSGPLFGDILYHENHLKSYNVGIWVAFDSEGQTIMFISWSWPKMIQKLISLIFILINLEQKVVISFNRGRNFWVIKKKIFLMCAICCYSWVPHSFLRLKGQNVCHTTVKHI